MVQRTHTAFRQLKLSRPGLLAALVVLGLLTIYFWPDAQEPPLKATQAYDSNKTLDSSSHLLSAATYLLGHNADATKLWFPPILDKGTSAFKPQPATVNQPPPIGKRPRTPLFIAFTRNNAMLQQAVLSYLAVGWPREDIIVVDNSGTMDANNRGLLSTTNPFFLDYTVLRSRYGVSILQTPTLLSFSQLQNFFLRTGMAHNWRFFFWSHMDVAVLSDETAQPYQSFYQRVLNILGDLGIDDLNAADDASAPSTERWALKYFTYDWLTLINVAPWRQIGQWDVFIPYYSSDCDAYSRLAMNGFTKDDVRAGHLFDVQDVIDDPEGRFFPADDKEASADDLNSPRYQALLADLRKLQDEKPENARNKWQGSSLGGKGDPWTYDPDGFQKMWWDVAGFGRKLYKKKWGTEECRLDEHGGRLSDAFGKE